MSKNQKHLVKRYYRADMLMHWVVAIGFVFALISGFVIFFKGTSALLVTEAGYVIRIIHRIGAVMFILSPLIYFILSKRRFGFLEAFKWNKSDFGWLKAAPKHYFVGGKLPAQGKYNTGQKLYYLFAVLFGVLLAVSGIVLWFGFFSETVGLIMIFVHDVSAVILTLFFFLHVYLTVFHPHERVSFNAMATGYMDRKYAKNNHELWYNEVIEQEQGSAGKLK